jgi:hypothetical protein
MSGLNSQQQFDNIISKYLDNVTNTGLGGTSELEVRFGTRGVNPISKIDFDNVIQKLKSVGFHMETMNDYSLKIQSEFIDKKTGMTKQSNVRVEINGIHNIQKYCATNSLTISEINPLFTQKQYAYIDNAPTYPVNLDEYNMRVSYQTEKNVKPYSPFAENIKSTWEDSKKTFRYINRISFTHSDFPLRVDMSIVKSSDNEKATYKGRTIYKSKSEYTFQAANITDSPEKYEIELELLNNKVGPGTDYNDKLVLMKSLKKVVKYVLSGLQNTNYPISYSEIKKIGVDYLKLVHGKEYNERMRMVPRFFMGPSSTTLQNANIAPINDDSTIPNIRMNYTVTEKADGMRKLMYIAGDGKIYLIDTNMNVQFTGAITNDVDLAHSILDGEHILHNKKGDFINLYAAFDVYIVNKKDVRSNSFIPPYSDDKETIVILTKYRLPVMISIMKNLNAKSVVNDSISPMRFTNKQFKADNPDQSIFQCCDYILSQEKQGLYEYEIDGLIFTPANYGVGSDREGDSGPLFKTTWDYSFKWKPTKYNTVDFLVSTKKEESSTQDFIGNVFQNGTNANSYEQLSQYKTLILRVGFDEKKHGYINPCADVINDKLPTINEDRDNNETYKPLPFYPTNPYDADASICNVMLESDQSGNKRLISEEGEVFDDETIVEFRYDLTREKKWRWVPLRVRYDKTAEYKRGFKQYGNAYHVANNNWHSIHNPITEEMIRTGLDIPDELGDDDVYYNRVSGTSNTEGLRDFHNLFVKRMLINSVSKRGDTLIDYAVGKGGDFPKWIFAKLSFVFGIDVAKDNIENRIDGACARYLNYHKKFKVMPSALFVNGNSSSNIRDGEAIYTEKSKMITKAIFGEGAKDKEKLGLGVYKQYGKANDGFNISSCQFALHYFFENKRTINSFLRNVSECTKVKGYFIGTCYNGNAIFDALRGLSEGESMSILQNDKKLWQITKGYDHVEFENDETSLGYSINVYQESINKTFSEYLVNFDYLERLMENYGFAVLTRDECKEIGIPASVGSFQQLYGSMENEIDKNPRKKNDYGQAYKMTAKEKQISFYNNYFIYKKVRNVDTRAVYNTMIGSSKLQEQMERLQEKEAITAATEQEEEDKPKPPKKLKRKLKLQMDSKE